MKKLKKLLLILLLILLLLIIFLFFLMTTHLGVQLIVKTAHYLDLIEYKHIAGNLQKHLSIQKLKVTRKDYDLKIDQLEIDWNLFSFFTHGYVIVDNFFASGVNLVSLKESATNSFSLQQNFPSTKPFKYIFIKKLNIDSLKINQHEISSIRFTTLLHNHALAMQFPEGNLQADYETFWQPTLQLRATLNAIYAKNTLTLNGKTTPEESHFNWQLIVPTLSSFGKNYQGQIKSDGVIHFNEKQKNVSANLIVNHLKINDTTINKVEGSMKGDLIHSLIQTNLFIDKANLATKIITDIHLVSNSQLIGNDLKNKITIFLNKQETLNSFISLPQFATTREMHQAIVGNLQFRLNNLTPYLKIPDAQSLQGYLQGNIALSGYLDNPNFRGEIALKNLSMKLIPYGSTINQLNLLLAINNKNLSTVTGTFNMGSGHGSLQGKINLFATAYPFEGTLNGRDLEVYNRNKLVIHISPNVTLKAINGNLNIDGLVLVPFLELKNLNISEATTFPSEVEWVGQKNSGTPRAMSMNIILRLGNYVRVETKNLRATLMGAITIHQLPGGLPSALGEFIITEGEYLLYNQLFEVHSGRLIYMGNLLTNPGLNLNIYKAVKTENTLSKLTHGWISSPTRDHGIKVGASVRGTLDEPLITLISDPPMSQDDILSYLLYGYRQSTMGVNNTFSALTAIATNFNLLGPSGENEGGGFSEVVKVGLTNPLQMLNLRHELTQHFVLQTEASPLETGFDLLYEYETD